MSENKRVIIITTIAASMFVAWASWASAMILAHSIAISEFRTWKDGRPQFPTIEQVSAMILRAQTESQEKMSGKLDSILEKVTVIDKRMSEHIARQTP